MGDRPVMMLGYGLKFWPEKVQKLKTANPHLAWFAEGVEKCHRRVKNVRKFS